MKKTKRLRGGLLLIALLILGSAIAYAAEAEYEAYIATDTRFGVQSAGLLGDLARDYFKADEEHIMGYSAAVDLLAALDQGRIDAALVTSDYAKQIESEGAYPDFHFILLPEEIHIDRAAPVFATAELRDRYNAWLKTIKEDGTWQEICDFWLSGPLPDEADIPRIDLTGENGTLVMADTGDYPPYSYMDSNHAMTGFDADIMRRFAQHMGKDVDFRIMAYDALLPYVAGGMADMSAATYAVTEDRADGMLFGEPTIITQAVMIVRGGAEEAPAKAADDALTSADFIGLRFAATTGTIYDEVAQNYFQASEILYVSDNTKMFEMVRLGKADVIMMNEPMSMQILRQPTYSELTSIVAGDEVELPPGSTNDVAVAFEKGNAELIGQYDQFLRQISEDGTKDALLERWFGENALPEEMPDIPLTGENGELVVAITGEKVPFDYVGADGVYLGFEVEQATRFAQYLGKSVRFEAMVFDAIIPYVSSGRADMGASAFSPTAERKKSVDFGDPYTKIPYRIVFRKDLFGAKNTSAAAALDFKGSNFAILVGSLYDEIADSMFEAKEKLYFPSVPDELNAVSLGKADAALLDEVVAKVQLRMGGIDNMVSLPVNDASLDMEFGVFSARQDIIDEYNIFLAEIQADGTYDEMFTRWVDNFDASAPVPDIPLTGEKGTLTFAINSSFPPFSFPGADGTWSGFDIEQIYRFAAWAGYDVEIAPMDFSAMLPYISSGKADLGSSIYITEERRQSVIFSNPSAKSPTVLVTREDHPLLAAGNTPAPEEPFSFTKWVQEGIQNNLLQDNRYRLILDGLAMTLQIAFASQLFGTLLGCLICYMLLRKNRLVRGIARLYNGLIHGLPAVVLLMISYYVLFGKSDVPALLIAIAAFTLVEGAAIGGLLAMAISTVDPVEIEAARSLGFSSASAFFTVTLPQAVRLALPGYMTGFVELVKATAIVGYISIQDLSRAADIIRSRTFDAYFPLIFVALIYLFVTTICVQVFQWIARRVAK